MGDVYWKWDRLGKQRNIDSWEMYPSMVNAYFNPPANEASITLVDSVIISNDAILQIVFPAGILRAPFFNGDW